MNDRYRAYDLSLCKKTASLFVVNRTFFHPYTLWTEDSGFPHITSGDVSNTLSLNPMENGNIAGKEQDCFASQHEQRVLHGICSVCR